MRIHHDSISKTFLQQLPLLSTFVSTLAVGVLLAGSASASTASFGVIRAALGTPGVVDQQVLRYPLVRKDLSPTLQGVAISSGTLAGGYLAFEQLSKPKSFFYDGSIPVLDKELPAVEKALSQGNLAITTITDVSMHASVNVVLVHIEGTATDTELAATLPTVLALTGNPQLGVVEMEVPESSLSLPSGVIPMKDLKLFDKGTFSVINGDTIVFSMPRADAARTQLGPVTASEPLGVGQTIVTSGNGSAGAIVAEFALRSDEVQEVTATLLAGGFTITSQSDYFVDDSDRLTFIRAEAVSKNPDVDKATEKFERQGQTVLNALTLIKKHSS